MSTSTETAVREAAELLAGAIEDAEAAGYVVDWPAGAASLRAIAISATAAVADEPVGEEAPEAVTTDEQPEDPADTGPTDF